jgi:hypothetical protein
LTSAIKSRVARVSQTGSYCTSSISPAWLVQGQNGVESSPRLIPLLPVSVDWEIFRTISHILPSCCRLMSWFEARSSINYKTLLARIDRPRYTSPGGHELESTFAKKLLNIPMSVVHDPPARDNSLASVVVVGPSTSWHSPPSELVNTITLTAFPYTRWPLTGRSPNPSHHLPPRREKGPLRTARITAAHNLCEEPSYRKQNSL